MLEKIYLDVAKYVATEIIDVDFDCEYKDGEIVMDIQVRIPVAKTIEETFDKLLVESK